MHGTLSLCTQNLSDHKFKMKKKLPLLMINDFFFLRGGISIRRSISPIFLNELSESGKSVHTFELDGQPPDAGDRVNLLFVGIGEVTPADGIMVINSFKILNYN